MIVFLLIRRLMAFTSAWKSEVTGARRNLISKYCAALSYAEWALSGMILQTRSHFMVSLTKWFPQGKEFGTRFAEEIDAMSTHCPEDESISIEPSKRTAIQ